MSLNFQNKIVFPAPETSYTTQSAFGQVVYIPRNMMQQVDRKLSKKKPLQRSETLPSEFKNTLSAFPDVSRPSSSSQLAKPGTRDEMRQANLSQKSEPPV